MFRRLAVFGAALALTALIGSAVAPAASSERSESDDRVVRWDLVHFVSAVILSGGEDVSQDEDSRDLVTLTGSGHAKPSDDDAFGGGTFLHAKPDGTVVAQGAYVTDFIKWRRIEEGTLGGAGLVGGIANIDDATSGILKLRVRLVPEIDGAPGPSVDAVLTIYCVLPGAEVNFAEGVRLKIPKLGFDFVQHHDHDLAGFTLFHLIR